MSLSVVIDSRLSAMAELPEQLRFAEPPLGMSTFSLFDVAPLDSQGLMFTLRAAEHPDTRLFAITPLPYFPDYDPRLSDEARAAIGLAAGEAPVLLAIVNPSADGAITANLLAPIVVDPATGVAAQIVLDDDRWPLRATLGTESDAT